MLGRVVQAAGELPSGEISTRLVDELMARWGRAVQTMNLGAEGAAEVWFRASDAHNLCPRLYALAVRDGIPLRAEQGAEDLWPMAVGTGYHRAFQEEILPDAMGAVFQGGWERIDGQDVRRALVDGSGPYVRQGWAPRPEGRHWRFVEPRGEVPDLWLRGHWDGVLVWPDAPAEVLELKSIREERFAAVNPFAGGRALPDHVLQVHAYMLMSGLDRARIVYICKGARDLRGSVAEHVVMRDEAVMERLRASLRACRAAVEAAAEGVLPARPAACRIRSDARARRCDLRDACFVAKDKA